MASELDTTISIVSLESLKSFLKESSNNLDNDLENLINGVSQWMNNYVGRQLKEAAHTEYYDGNDLNVLPVNNYPVSAVVSLNIDSAYEFNADSAIPVSSVLILNTNELTLKGYTFDKGLNNVKLVYSAGYTDTTMPADLKQVCLHLCKMINSKANQESAGVSTINYPNGSVGFIIDKAMPPWCKDVLDKYVRL